MRHCHAQGSVSRRAGLRDFHVVYSCGQGVVEVMDKRIEKRHKRQVARAKQKVRVSEPDVRTREQIEAAREASRPDSNLGSNPKLAASARSLRGNHATSTGSASKTDS